MAMSGPIIRKYGFPNFDKIFGERALEHGVDEPEKSEEGSKAEESAGSRPASGSGSESTAGKQPADGK
jgi:hypothetical protein